jgi:hypothetical protein
MRQPRLQIPTERPSPQSWRIKTLTSAIAAFFGLFCLAGATVALAQGDLTLTIAGKEVRALRHGMAGEPGYEMWGPWRDVEQHPLASPFRAQAPGPHVEVRLRGMIVSAGDAVERP